MSGPEEAIRRVVEAFERSDWSEIDVRWGDVRVHLSTASLDGSAPASAAAAPAVDREPAAPSSPDPTGGSDEPPPGAHVVVAPSPGIFWRSPEPGLPPFVDVGGAIEASATVCIVEVMKLMNHVKAGVSGSVVAVYADNGVAVRKGQALFAISPSEDSS